MARNSVASGKPKKKVQQTSVQRTRKELRKQKELDKKAKKRNFFSKNFEPINNGVNTSAKSAKTSKPVIANAKQTNSRVVCADSITSSDDEDLIGLQASGNVKSQCRTALERPEAATTRMLELKRERKLRKDAGKQRLKALRLDNAEENKNIAKLEKKLKLDKAKDKNRLVRKMFSDGLDYLLDFCLDDDEYTKKPPGDRLAKKQPQHNVSDIEDEEQAEDEETANEFEVDSGSEESNVNMQRLCKYTEDIYGRQRGKDGTVVVTPADPSDSVRAQTYMPPHQRNSNGESDAIDNLRRHCKGLMNRLSESNLHKIAVGIEELYLRNSRHNMNETLTKLFTEALLARTLVSERLMQEHMVLVAYLHAHVGSEIGAHFLQFFIERFDKLVRDMHVLAIEDKQLNNLVLVLAYMYLFRIYEHRLLFQIVGCLMDSLCEKAVECLLLIYQSVGFRLRKDDPHAFKQMLLDVQRKIASASLELKENPRLKFMLEILSAVKNNNMTKLAKFDPELADTLAKRLHAMLRNDKYVVTLNIAMADLLRADLVGKWWIVGSAWSGKIADVAGARTAAKDTAATTAGGQSFSAKLLQLAKAQSMNTPERRDVFCIVMSADDYVDAFEKILHLSLRDQRIVAYIVLHCCLNEQRANPYYSHLALKFCQYNRRFQLAFQFATWDCINNSFGSLKRTQTRNLAHFLHHLILHGGLSISVLKVVDFLQLDNASFRLMREIMVRLLLAEPETAVVQCFERVARNAKLQQFKNSIRLFMQHFLTQTPETAGLAKLKLDTQQSALLCKRVGQMDNILSYMDL